MRFEVAVKQERVQLLRWDGSNVDELNTYINSVQNTDGKVYAGLNDDGTAFVQHYNTEKPLPTGSLVNVIYGMFGGPVITIYTPDEVNAKFYPYPDHEAVFNET